MTTRAFRTTSEQHARDAVVVLVDRGLSALVGVTADDFYVLVDTDSAHAAEAQRAIADIDPDAVEFTPADRINHLTYL